MRAPSLVTPTYLSDNQAGLWLAVPGFDDLALTDDTIDDDGHLFQIKVMDDSTLSRGTPDPVEVQVQRWMIDGAVASVSGYGNRQIAFTVEIAATTSVDLAWGEAALVLRLKALDDVATLGYLRWVPPEGDSFAPTSVFDVWVGQGSEAFSSASEQRLARRYTITLTAKPWVRSLDQVTVAAIPTSGSATVTSVDACTSTTGWTGSPNTPTVAGGTAVRETQSFSTGFSGGKFLVTSRLTRTGVVTGMGTLPYLVIDMGLSPAYKGAYAVTVDGHTCAQVGQVGTSIYFQVPTGVTSFTKLVVSATANIAGTGNGTLIFDIRDVSKTDKVGATTTHKMFNRHMDVGGSVPTSGSIQLASPSATILGTCLVYTCPDVGNSYSPSLRQYRTAGGTLTADSTCVSGQREAFVTSGASAATNNYSIPAGQYRAGTYVVVMRLATSSGPDTLSVTVDATTTSVGTQPEDNVFPVAVDGSSGFWAILGTITLPAQARPSESLLDNRIVVLATAAGSTTHTLDEVFLLDVTHGAYTLVTGADDGSPLSEFTRLWIDSPDQDPVNNLPQIYQGTAADRSDAFRISFAQIMSPGEHDLDSSGVQVFTVTDRVNDAVVTGSFFHRWHTNPGD